MCSTVLHESENATAGKKLLGCIQRVKSSFYITPISTIISVFYFYDSTVVTNPPFGTKDNAGIDLQFLRTATRLARRAVYSFHKRSTRKFLLKTIRDDWGYSDAQVVAEMAFDVPNMYKFHKQQSKDIEVDLIRISIDSKSHDVEENNCVENEEEQAGH